MGCVALSQAEVLQKGLPWAARSRGSAAAWHPPGPRGLHLERANPQESPAVPCWCLPSIKTSVCLEIQRRRVHVLWQLTWAEERCLFCRAGIFPDGLVERSTVWWLPLKMLCKLRTLPCCVTKQNRFRFGFFFIFRIILDIVVCQILWMANTQISQIKEIWSNGRLDHISFVVEIIVNGVKLWCWLFMQW